MVMYRIRVKYQEKRRQWMSSTCQVSAGITHESVLVDVNPKDGKIKLKSDRIMTRSSIVVKDVQT